MTKPNPPVTVYFLALVAVAGLVAQYLAARAAFDQVLDNSAHSVAAALLIESAAVVDALVLMRSRSWTSALGLVIALLVSGTYNYLQAEAAQPAWDWWRVGSIAVGPLAALVSVGLVLGEEWRRYEVRLVAWQAEQQAVAEAEAERRRVAEVQEQRRREQEAARQRQAEAEKREFERELKRQRMEHELKEERLARRRRERWERKQAKASGQVSGQEDGDRSVSGQVSDQGQGDRSVSGQVSGQRNGDRSPSGQASGRPVRWPDKEAFLSDLSGRPDRLAELTGKPLDQVTGADLAALAGISARTGRRWLDDLTVNGKGA